jgi:hypothetical protein
LPDLYDTMENYFQKAFNKDSRIPSTDAKKAATMIIEIIGKLMTFKGDYGN